MNTAVLIADANGVGHMSGLGWGMMWVGWLTMSLLIGLIVWAVIRSTSHSSPAVVDATASAQRILADRFARGEIDVDEYRRRLDEIGS